MKKALGSALVLGTLAISAIAVNSNSGLSVGETVTPFHPKHVTGPNKGTDACPPCTYGNRPQVQVWINGDSFDNVAGIAKTLDAAVKDNAKAQLKGFVIFMVPGDKSEAIAKKLEGLAEKTAVKDIALAYLPNNDEAVENYKINTAADVKNTIIVYRNRKVESKFVNLKADEKGLAELSAAIDKTIAG